MECSDERGPDPLGQERVDPLPHLPGSLIGKGDGEDRVGPDPGLYEVRDTVGDGLGFSCPCPGYDEERSLGMQDRLLLLGVESF